MFRKIVQFSSIIQIILCIVTYFTISYQFDADIHLMRMLASSDLVATLLRLSIYVIPGVHLIGGLFGLTFSTKKLLSFVGVLMILASIFTIYYAYTNKFMLVIGISALVLSILYLIGAILTKVNK